MNKLTNLVLALASGIALPSLAFSATVGTDNASASAYDSGWANETDGSITGPGAYGMWFLNPDTSDITHETASVSSLSSNAPLLDTNGVSFRMAGTNGAEATAFRFIDPGGLSAGQSFSIDLAVNFRNGYKGIDLRGTSEETIFNFNVGDDDYVVNSAATGNGSIGNTYSDDTLFHIVFTQDSASGGTWSITRSGGVDDYASGTYDGVARSIKLYVGSTAGTDADALFFNNLSTIPEPGQMAVLFGAVAYGLVALRRRKKA
jgi:hypothetical protein